MHGASITNYLARLDAATTPRRLRGSVPYRLHHNDKVVTLDVHSVPETETAVSSSYQIPLSSKAVKHRGVQDRDFVPVTQSRYAYLFDVHKLGMYDPRAQHESPSNSEPFLNFKNLTLRPLHAFDDFPR